MDVADAVGMSYRKETRGLKNLFRGIMTASTPPEIGSECFPARNEALVKPPKVEDTVHGRLHDVQKSGLLL